MTTRRRGAPAGARRIAAPGGLRRPRGDDGNAIVEFVYLAVLLMVPLVYVMLAAFDTQRTSFGVTEAARQAGRAWVVSGCDRAYAERAAALAMSDQGVGAHTVSISGCPGPGEQAVVQVRAFVQLRGAAGLLPADRAGFSVSGSFVAVRDRFAP